MFVLQAAKAQEEANLAHSVNEAWSGLGMKLGVLNEASGSLGMRLVVVWE